MSDEVEVYEKDELKNDFEEGIRIYVKEGSMWFEYILEQPDISSRDKLQSLVSTQKEIEKEEESPKIKEAFYTEKYSVIRYKYDQELSNTKCENVYAYCSKLVDAVLDSLHFIEMVEGFDTDIPLVELDRSNAEDFNEAQILTTFVEKINND